jgi:hypothetical protein
MKLTKNFLLLNIIIFFTCRCTSPRIEFNEPISRLNDHSTKLFLTELKATDSIYSILFFTSHYDRNMVAVKNGSEIIFNDKLTSDLSFGLANTLRFDNRFDVEIKDIQNDYSFKINNNISKKYKYIYIKRNIGTGKYSIQCSHNLKAFY